ncbi:MAG: Crp/Fnr family transcriptional regulator [Chitinophagaceae bacterium]|nr:MAG: Crp/Fnr family transcriptional regulator [Chitinophagaceae bacterium]
MRPSRWLQAQDPEGHPRARHGSTHFRFGLFSSAYGFRYSPCFNRGFSCSCPRHFCKELYLDRQSPLMYELLFRHFNKYLTLTPEEMSRIEPFFQYRKYRKHQYIIQEGDVSRYETFILKGCIRTYEVDEKGQEHIIQIGVEDWWIGDLYSFWTGNPTKLNVDCVEDCEVLQVTAANHERLCEEVPKLERHFRKLLQSAYVASLQRIYSSMSRPAAERYQEFLEKYPHIEQRVPNHYIASYLGITPQSLSRLRSQSRRSKAK